MVGCAALGCFNSTDKKRDLDNVPPDASFHAFPLKNAELLQKWLENLGRKDFRPTRYSKLCSAHFLPQCFDIPVPALGDGRKKAVAGRLFKDAVPTEFRRPSVSRKGQLSAVVELPPMEEFPRPTTSSSAVEQVPVGRKRKRTSTVTREMLEQEGSSAELAQPMSTSSSLFQGVTVSVPALEEDPTSMDPSEQEEALVSVHTEFLTPQKMDPPPVPTASKVVVHSLFGTPHRTGKDHPYAMGRKSRTFGTQTVADSPAKGPAELSSPLTSPFKSEGFEEEVSEYAPFSESSSSGDSSSDTDKQADLDPCKMKKFIVFEDCLNELHKFCKICGSAVTECVQFTRGSLVGYKISCHTGHSYVWHSQPLDRKQRLGNLLIAAAILITGGTFGKMKAFADALNLTLFSKTVFNKLQKLFILPVIQEYWETERKKACEEMRPLSPIVVAGDGRCDSPGHSAKYGSYTLMHTDGDGKTGSRKIVSMKLVQVSEVKNSNHMEPEGMKRCLKVLTDEQLKVGVLATDRHIMISSIMKKEYKEIDHQFDTWHLAKSVIKKLTAIAKTKNCSELAPWIQSISNHLWWACATCNQDEQLLREKWLSVLHHVTNRHQWSGNQKFHECEHQTLSREDRKTVIWLKPNSPAFKSLQKVFMDKKLLNAMGHLTKFCHTGELEVFHNMLLKFCPKRQHFHYDAMSGRLMLAAIDWNTSRREQKTDQRGKPATSVEFSKRRKAFVLKNRYHKVNRDYPTELLTRIHQVHHEDIKLKPIERPVLVAQNVAAADKPSKEELEAKFKSRFR